MGVGTLISSQERRALAVPVINCGSTADFVLPSVYKRFLLLLLGKGSSGQLSTILWRAGGTVGFVAKRPVGILFCSDPPRHAAPPCSSPTRPARDIFGFWIRPVPGHAFHEKVLQRQKSFGPLVGSQEQRALLVLRLHRGSADRQPGVVLLHRFT